MNPSFPIGDFDYDTEYKAEDAPKYIAEIEALPARLKEEIESVPESFLNTPYRTGGWSVRKVMHHICDSHLNAFIRIKNTLTEDHPTIKPYEQHLWAEQGDYEDVSVEDALIFIEILHKKMVATLKRLTTEELNRTLHHPADEKYPDTLVGVIALYAWHGNHHLAHIQLVTRPNR